MPINEIGTVRSGPTGFSAGTYAPAWLDGTGALVVIDFFAKAIMDGKGYQVRAGTVTTPLVGDVVITDTAAEYCVDSKTGLTVIPLCSNISIRLGTGTLHEYAIKSVATASTGGAAFVALPLRAGTTAAAASATCRVAAAGGVTVTAELATTTQRHWSFAQPIAMGAYVPIQTWEPLRPPLIEGDRCIYTQIAATTTGPSYFANMDWVEFGTATLRV
jgi:hypothetical protein